MKTRPSASSTTTTNSVMIRPSRADEYDELDDVVLALVVCVQSLPEYPNTTHDHDLLRYRDNSIEEEMNT